jgi:hypothetical protein
MVDTKASIIGVIGVGTRVAARAQVNYLGKSLSARAARVMTLGKYYMDTGEYLPALQEL